MAMTRTRTMPEHGTRARYAVERRQDGRACGPCTAANTAYHDERRRNGRVRGVVKDMVTGMDVSNVIDEIGRVLHG